MTRRYRSSLLE